MAFNIACVCNRGDSIVKVVEKILQIVDYQRAFDLLLDACSVGCQKAVELILDKYPALINDDGSFTGGRSSLTPLETACSQSQFSLMKYLVSRGVDVNTFTSLLQVAIHWSRNR
ncbi:MAG: ankyrin repeat domain-containing protein, partial [Opitutales bacterium]|nr:ankyrin repeat domain-containing protein [Opitutales bacterium]